MVDVVVEVVVLVVEVEVVVVVVDVVVVTHPPAVHREQSHVSL